MARRKKATEAAQAAQEAPKTETVLDVQPEPAVQTKLDGKSEPAKEREPSQDGGAAEAQAIHDAEKAKGYVGYAPSEDAGDEGVLITRKDVATGGE